MAGIFDNDPTNDDLRIPGWGRFETSVLRQEIEPLYPREMYRYALRETFTIDDQTICPDIVICVDGTVDDCACAVEVKDREKLERADVEKVIDYQRLLKPERTMLFVRAGCDARTTATDLAKQNGIDLRPHEVHL